MKKERAEERKRIDEERTRKGIIGGFTLDGKSYKASRSGVQKSEWNMFQKDLFFTGGSVTNAVKTTLNFSPRVSTSSSPSIVCSRGSCSGG